MAKKKAAKKKVAKKAVKKKATAKKVATKKVAKKAPKKAATKKAPKKAAKKAAKKAPKKAAEKAAKKAPKKAAKKAATKKVVKKKAAKTKVKRKPNPAFMRPLQPDASLGAVVGNSPLPRTQVVKKIWAYIKRNDLQDSKNKRMINADDKLKAVFGGKKQVSMFEMTKLVNRHLT